MVDEYSKDMIDLIEIKKDLKCYFLALEGDEVVGYNTKLTVKKNKIAPPMRTCTIPFMFGSGFGGSDEVLNLAIEYGFNILKDCISYSYDFATGLIF